MSLKQSILIFLGSALAASASYSPAAPVMTIEQAAKILNVNADENIEVVKKKYKALARKLHPDVRPNDKAQAEEDFIMLQEAWVVFRQEAEVTKYGLGHLKFMGPESIQPFLKYARMIESLVQQEDYRQLLASMQLNNFDLLNILGTQLKKIPASPGLTNFLHDLVFRNSDSAISYHSAISNYFVSREPRDILSAELRLFTVPKNYKMKESLLARWDEQLILEQADFFKLVISAGDKELASALADRLLKVSGSKQSAQLLGWCLNYSPRDPFWGLVEVYRNPFLVTRENMKDFFLSRLTEKDVDATRLRLHIIWAEKENWYNSLDESQISALMQVLVPKLDETSLATMIEDPVMYKLEWSNLAKQVLTERGKKQDCSQLLL